MLSNTPSCFGKQWEASHPECLGGNDPTYVHPGNGSNKRDQCKWYQQCSHALTSQRTQKPVQPPYSAQPPTSYAHPVPAVPRPAPPHPLPVLQAPPVPTYQYAPAHPTPYAAPVPHFPPQASNHAAPQQVMYQGQVYTQPGMAAMPTMVPMNQPMQGAETQSFLMVPEPYDTSATHWQRLYRTMLRSMGKSAALSFANYMDYYPVGGRPPEPPR